MGPTLCCRNSDLLPSLSGDIFQNLNLNFKAKKERRQVLRSKEIEKGKKAERGKREKKKARKLHAKSMDVQACDPPCVARPFWVH